MTRNRPLALLVILAFLPVAGFALDLDASTPANNASGVPTDVRIDLRFSNNVADADLQELNASKIVLLSPGGALVPFTLEMADVEANRDRRRNIVVVPDSPLDAGATYVVVILPGLTARNGSSVASAVTVTFTTAE